MEKTTGVRVAFDRDATGMVLREPSGARWIGYESGSSRTLQIWEFDTLEQAQSFKDAASTLPSPVRVEVRSN